jgi:hypothetical protein
LSGNHLVQTPRTQDPGLTPVVARFIGDGEQVRDEKARIIGIDPLLEKTRDVLESDQLDPATGILQGLDDLQEIAVARDQEHLIEPSGLEHGIHGHVEIGVGLGSDIAVFVGVAAHGLGGDLPAKVSHHLLIGLGLLFVFGVLARALGIEGHIGVETLQHPAIARGEAPQDVVTQLIAAVVAHILGVDKDSNSKTRRQDEPLKM